MLTLLWSDKYFVPAVLVLAVGIAMCWLGVSMPRSAGWPSAPGLFPILIGCGLILMSVALLLEGLRRGAPFVSHLRMRGRNKALSTSNGSSLRTLVGEHFAAARTLVIVLVYVVILLRYLPYEIATLLFVGASLHANGVRSWRTIIVVSVGTSFVLAAVFVLLLESLLPGTTSLVEQWLYR